MIIDELRRAYPHVGLSVYAIDPYGAVTLEVHTSDGAYRSFVGATVQETLERAFPLFFEQPIEHETDIPVSPPNAFD